MQKDMYRGSLLKYLFSSTGRMFIHSSVLLSDGRFVTIRVFALSCESNLQFKMQVRLTWLIYDIMCMHDSQWYLPLTDQHLREGTHDKQQAQSIPR